MIALAEPEGVICKILSLAVKSVSASDEPLVTAPINTLIPLSIKLLYAFTALSSLASSSWKLSANVYVLSPTFTPPAALISSIAIVAPFFTELP